MKNKLKKLLMAAAIIAAVTVSAPVAQAQSTTDPEITTLITQGSDTITDAKQPVYGWIGVALGISALAVVFRKVGLRTR